MKVASASKLHRKSGVRFGERGAPVRFPLGPLRHRLLRDSSSRSGNWTDRGFSRALANRSAEFWHQKAVTFDREKAVR